MTVLKFSNGLIVHTEVQELEYQGKREHLSDKPWKLLKRLLEDAPKTVTHKDLYIAIYDEEKYNDLPPEDVPLDIQMGARHTLSAFLGNRLNMPKVNTFIKNEKGVGYCLAEKPEEVDACDATFKEGGDESRPEDPLDISSSPALTPSEIENTPSEIEKMRDIPGAVAIWKRVQEENDPDEIAPYLDRFRKHPKANMRKDALVLTFDLDRVEKASDAECRALALPLGDTIRANAEMVFYEPGEDELVSYYCASADDGVLPRQTVYASSHAAARLIKAEKESENAIMLFRPTSQFGYPFGDDDQYLWGVKTFQSPFCLDGYYLGRDAIRTLPILTATARSMYGTDKCPPHPETSFQGFIVKEILNILVPLPVAIPS